MAPTSSIYLRCLCGAISEPGNLSANDELPISTEMCHCNPCRYTTGSLGAFFPRLKAPPSSESLSKLTGYQSSQNVTRYFCSTCGCHCFVDDSQQGDWWFLAGIMEQNPASKMISEDTVELTRHAYVLDTLDGGLAPLLLELNGRSIPAWPADAQEPSLGKSTELPPSSVLSLPSKSASSVSQPRADSYLPAKCHCGGVSLLIKRANFPSYDGEARPRYIPSDPTKYMTYLCACRSCRLSTGVALTPWALVLPENVFNANAPGTATDNSSAVGKSPVPVAFGSAASSPDANQGLTLKHHWSSDDTCRSFCGNCGATVSYWCSQRPEELDLAVGIVRAEEGSMARTWLEWIWGECSFTEECIDKELCDAWTGCAETMKNLA